jgi:diguanylate cyclase (GGDEF)-like protein/PAS domain S-box-containing protein
MTPIQQKILHQVIIDPVIDNGRLLRAADLIVKGLMEGLGILRAGAWQYQDDQRSTLEALLVIDRQQQQHQQRDTSTTLKRTRYPVYFRALDSGQIIAVNDTRQDPRTEELLGPYLGPLNITSLLHMPVRIKGNTYGVVCCERVGCAAPWTESDRLFAALLTDQFCRCIAAAEKSDQFQELQQSNRQLSEQTKQLDELNQGVNHFSLISRISPLGIITQVNANYLNLTGYLPEELIGKPQALLYSSVHGAEYFQLMKRLLDQGTTWRGRICKLKKDGSPFWVDATIKPIHNSRGGLESYIGFYYDISQEVETENQLEQTERLAKQGSFRVHQEGDVWYCSGQMHRLLRVDKSATITAHHLAGALLETDYERLRAAMFGLTSEHTSFQLELRRSGQPDTWLTVTAQRLGHWIVGQCQETTDTVRQQRSLQETIGLQKAIFDSADLSIIATSRDGLISHFNRTAENLLGYRAEELINIENPYLFHDVTEVEDYANFLSAELSIPLRPGFEVLTVKPDRGLPEEQEWTYVAKDGSTISVSVAITPIIDEQGAISGYAVIARDNSRLNQIEQHSSQLDSILATAGDLASFGGFLYNIERDQIFITNQAFRNKVIAHPTQVLNLAQALNLFIDDDQQLISLTVKWAIAACQPFDIEARLKNPTGQPYWMRLAGQIQIDKQKNRTLLGFVQDINRHKKLERRLSQLAMTDQLTGLANRRALLQSLESEWRRHARYQTNVTILSLDIDHFKLVNDTWGHDIGDLVLVEFTNRIQSQMRASDIFGRMGGEEFLVIAANTPEQDAMALAEKIRSTIAQQAFRFKTLEQLEPLVIEITVSIGVAGLTSDLESLDQWLVSADKAMYRAKDSGRNRLVSYQQLISVDK